MHLKYSFLDRRKINRDNSTLILTKQSIKI